MSVKIYTDDPHMPFKTTQCKASYSKAEIDGLFAKWGIKDTWWHWEPEANDIFVVFKIKEEIDGRLVEVSAKIDAPVLWNHKTRKTVETVNWDISLRVMYWLIKALLDMAYLKGSSKTAAFLPHILDRSQQQTMKDYLIPQLQQATADYALEQRNIRKVVSGPVVDAETFTAEDNCSGEQNGN